MRHRLRCRVQAAAGSDCGSDWENKQFAKRPSLKCNREKKKPERIARSVRSSRFRGIRKLQPAKKKNKCATDIKAIDFHCRSNDISCKRQDGAQYNTNLGCPRKTCFCWRREKVVRVCVCMETQLGVGGGRPKCTYGRQRGENGKVFRERKKVVPCEK
jgi:hypothetical protein